MEKALLRIGAFELKERLDVPYRVVINESIELAKVLAPTTPSAYVNGVLDKLAAAAFRRDRPPPRRVPAGPGRRRSGQD